MQVKNFIKENWVLLLILSIVGIISFAFFMYIPLANKYVIDKGIQSKDKYILLQSILLFAGSLVIADIAFSIKQILMTYIESLYSLYLRQSIHRKVRELEDLNKFNEAQLISFQINDVNLAKQKLRRKLDNYLSYVQLIAILIFILIINYKFLLIAMLIIPIYSILPKILGKHITNTSLTIQKNLEEITEELSNSYSISNEIRIFQKEAWDITKMFNLFKKNVSPVVKLEVLNNLFVLGKVFYSLFLCVIFYFGSVMVQENQMSIGTLFALTSYIGFISGPVQSLVFNYGLLKSIKASEMQIINVLESKQRIKFNNTPDKQKIYNLRLSNICFKISDTEILNSVSFNLCNGEFVGIKGISGSGKSTLLNLIAKFIHPNNGIIYLNGRDIKDIPDNEFFNYVNYVFQDSNFIKGTLKENLFIESHEEQNFMKVADDLFLKLNLDFLHNNFEYWIEKDGRNLSGGQRQRLSIIRALLVNPPILLLDEVTSALDFEMSNKMIDLIKEMRKDKITIMVTHDLKVLKKFNRIFELNNGVLEEV
ncbi:ABC transporter ATP-binding protein [Bacillus sp. Bva_UNVM-123]|uniref:ATP-binding cassette domain-containing protein n=1 Tax=Bacillus sp. Bva_UNVM-123 TaxID=2829798 RepID=UPI00391EFC0A